MSDPTKILKQNHRAARDLLHDLKVSEPGNERSLLLIQLKASFATHESLAQSLLYPLFAESFGHDEILEPGTEHVMLDDCLDQLTPLLEKPGFGVMVAMLEGGVKHHVKREEQILLPALKKEIDGKEWNALGDQLLAATAAIEAEYRVAAAAAHAHDSKSDQKKVGVR
jgi:Hemerythrin HHE cation binding domain